MRVTLLTRASSLCAFGLAALLLFAATSLAARTSSTPPIAGTSGQLSGSSVTLQLGQAPDPHKINNSEPNAEFESSEGQPSEPKDTPYTPKEKPTFDTTPNASQAAPLTVFHNTIANPNAGIATQEPTAANGGQMVLATGNTWAQLSSDSGQTWPSSLRLNPTSRAPKGDTVCCDQLAYSVDRGNHTMFFWLVQDNCATIQCGTGNPTKQNALTLFVFKNGDKLASSATASKATACRIVLKPSNYGIKQAWFDFNKMSSTKKFLYLVTDVVTLKGAAAGVEIVRFALDKLDDGDCKPGRHLAWHLKNETSLAPVEHADSTMFFAEHINGTKKKGDELRIFSVDDSSTKLTQVDRDVNNYAPDTRGAGRCPSPDGNDTCQRFNDKQTVGFRSGKAVGWLWTAPQDSQFAFPHIRVAVFKTKGLKLATEHAIFSPNFAWTYPAVGVNNRGEIGLVIYKMGGGAFPSPHAFIIKHPKSESEWSGIGLHVLATGQASAFRPNTWGDYASVHAYSGCSNTFLATAWSVQKSGTEDRVVWFGDPKDGCANLAVTGSLALPATGSVGDQLSIANVTKNVGSGTAGASTTRYYLSKDGQKSKDDVRLIGSQAIPTLFVGGEFSPTPPTSVIIPPIAPGSYKLLDCADDLAAVTETTAKDNCFTDQTITVKAV